MLRLSRLTPLPSIQSPLAPAWTSIQAKGAFCLGAPGSSLDDVIRSQNLLAWFRQVAQLMLCTPHYAQWPKHKHAWIAAAAAAMVGMLSPACLCYQASCDSNQRQERHHASQASFSCLLFNPCLGPDE